MTVLTDGQVIRIFRFKDVLREHDHSTDEEAIRNFEADQAAEREIQTWEWIAWQYQERSKAQPEMNAEKRRALFSELFQRSFTG